MPVLVFLFLLVALPASAADSAQFRAWAAFSYSEAGAPTCYAATKPSERKGAPPHAGAAYIYITHRPAERSLNVFQYVPGVELKLGSTATLTIDGSKFTLFTTESGAWVRGADADRAIAEAIKKGSKLSITATAEGGKAFTDHFSLAGSSQALQAIAKLCGV